MPTAIPTVPSHSSNVPESPDTRAKRLALEEARRSALQPQQDAAIPARPRAQAQVPARVGMGLRGMSPQSMMDVGSIFREQDAARARMLADQRRNLGITGAAPASGYYGIDPTTGKPIAAGGLFKAPIARLFGGGDTPNFADKMAWWVGGRPFYPTVTEAGNPLPMPAPDSTAPAYPIPGGPYNPSMPSLPSSDGMGLGDGLGLNLPSLNLDWAGLYPEAGF